MHELEKMDSAQVGSAFTELLDSGILSADDAPWLAEKLGWFDS
ncbi:MAG TPA: hypothetical protein PKD68_02615 [Candidatus Saccharibacteria bacterium]|nr:hypothetical protein [Candidatus Saccharibacteria bacterium]